MYQLSKLSKYQECDISDDLARVLKYIRVKKAQLYHRWLIDDDQNQLKADELSQFFTIYEVMDHCFTYDLLEHRDRIFGSISEMIGEDIHCYNPSSRQLLTKLIKSFNDLYSAFDCFLESKSWCISTEFYDNLVQIMNDYGDDVNEDLCYMLRSVITNKICAYRSLAYCLQPTIKKDRLSFNEILDPYEALDLFIARPAIPQTLVFVTSIIQDWDLKYGSDFNDKVSKLNQISQNNFYDIENRMRIYSVTRNNIKRFDHEVNSHDPNNAIAISLELYVQLASSCHQQLTNDFAESSLEPIYKQYCLLEKSKILSAINMSSNYHQNIFFVREEVEMSQLSLFIKPLDYLDILICSGFDSTFNNSVDSDTIIGRIGASLRNSFYLFRYAMKHIYYLAPRAGLEKYRSKYNLNIDKYANEGIYKDVKSEVPIITYSLLAPNSNNSSPQFKAFEDSQPRIDNFHKAAELHHAAMQMHVREIYKAIGDDITDDLTKLLDQSLINRQLVRGIVNREINDYIKDDQHFRSYYFFGFFESLQLLIIKEDYKDRDRVIFDKAWCQRSIEEMHSKYNIDITGLLYHIIRLEDLLIEYLSYRAYITHGLYLRPKQEQLSIQSTLKLLGLDTVATSALSVEH